MIEKEEITKKITDPPDITLPEMKDRIKKIARQVTNKKATILPWKDSNKIIKEFSINPPSTTWMKLTVAERKHDHKKYLRLRRFRQNFNIHTPEHLANILDASKKATKIVGWGKGIESQSLKLMEKIDSLTEADYKNRERIHELSRKLADLRMIQLNMDIPKFKRDLAEFKNLLDGEHHENDLQEFLEKNTWLFGPEYLEKQPVYFSQFSLSDSRFDFMLQRYDTFYDIFEIKTAKAPLLNIDPSALHDLDSPTRKEPISGELKNALSQMIGYLELANIFARELRKNGIVLHKPKGKIIIGRRTKKEEKAIATLNSYLSHIEIMTYDDLLLKSQGFVEMIKRRRITE